MYSISVVIPTYNRACLISAAVDSVLMQNGQGEFFDIARILIIDDGSSDNTEDVIGRIDSDKIIYYRSKTNAGAAAARNTGVAMAKGEWIAFQDSDDIWHRDKLEKQVRYLRNNPDIDMVSHPIRATFKDGKEIVTDTLITNDPVTSLAARNYIDTPTMLVRKEAFEMIGGFNTDFTALEDWDLALRFAGKYNIGMVGEPLIESDMTIEGVSSDVSKYYENRCRIISRNRDLLLAHNCFDTAVQSLFEHADTNGILPQIGKMLELYISEGM